MYRVVIADDESIIRKGLRESVEWDSLGLEISGEAGDGVEALGIIKANKPHILITDISMPEMDGIKLIKEVKNIDLNIKIIILSGFSDYAFLKEAIKLGVESYLLKPIDNDELISNLIDSVNNIEKEIFETTQLHQGTGLLRANTLNRLVTNGISLSEFEEKASFLDISLEAEKYLCAVCVAENIGSGAFSNYEQLAMLAVHNICNELAENGGAVFIDAKGRVVFLFSNIGEDDLRTTADAVLANASGQVLEHLGISLTASVGMTVSSVGDIWRSYDSAAERFNCEKAPADADKLEWKGSAVIDRTVAYIAEHYNVGITLKQVAEVCHINTSYLGQLFKKEMGESFTEYINKYRIQKAKELLSSSSLKVYEIAETVGFTDYHYFLKIFKKIVGVNPTEVRN